MLTVGKEYKLGIWEDDGVTEYWNCRVIEVDMPVVKFSHAGSELIINLSSKGFFKAEPQDT